MRLHRLTVEAWGPFPGRETVDFDALAGQGLFLIHGATGAGKTSILDAICYGLYAAVPGARAGVKRLASDHAPLGVVPQVTLDFTAGGRRLRITRNPSFARPKKSRTGWVDVPAKVVLEERVDGRWLTRSTRAQEADDVVRDAVGMGREQFSTVVLLPQGEFATFLRAKPEERRDVLEKLFDVSRFVDVEAWLAERRRVLGDQVATQRSALASEWDRLGDAVSAASAVPAQGEPITCGDAPGSAQREWTSGLVLDDPQQARVRLGELCAGLSALAGEAHVRADAAQLAQAAVRHTGEQALALAERQRRHAEGAAELADLATSAPEHQSLLASLDGARRADRVAPALAALDGVVPQFDAARATLRRELHNLTVLGCRIPASAEGVLAGAEDPPGASKGPVVAAEDPLGAAEDPLPLGGVSPASAEVSPGIRGWLSDLTGSLETMTPALVEVARLDSAAGQAARSAQEAERAAAAARATLAEVERSLADGLARHEGLVAVAAQRVTRAEALSAARHALTLAERRCRLGADRVELVANLVAVDAEILAHSLAENTAHTSFNELRSRQLAGMAADLAARLAEGSPCPVCGAHEHPAPAASSQRVDPAEVDDAERVWTQRRESTEQARVSRATLMERLGALDTELGSPTVSVEALRATRTTAEGEVTRTGASADEAERAQADADELARSIDDLRTRRDVCLTAQASDVTRAEAARSQATRLRQDMEAVVARHREHCPCPSTAKDIEALTQDHTLTLATARAGLAAASEGDRLGAEAAELTTRARESATTEGFASLVEAQGAILPRAVVTDLDGKARSRAIREGALARLLADPDLVDASGQDVPDLEEVKRALDAADRAAAQTHADSTGLDRASLLVTARRTAIEGLLDSLDLCLTEHSVVAGLAEVVAGTGANNSRRMRLSAYVLAGRLEEIVRLANERLTRMGEGRYTLDHSDSRAARGARSGLGLVVKDAWTGQTRETSTLSGGEAFMASLALALGLGDAVRAQAGGFDLQTLFVDEGFGSLDEDSLEQVMDVLDSLREGGRAVGIVSHVGELRQRVPAQVLVRKTETGSTVEVSTAPTAA